MHTLPASYMPAFFARAAKLDRRRQPRHKAKQPLPDAGTGYWYERPSDFDEDFF